jgi:hypothetical protein
VSALWSPPCILTAAGWSPLSSDLQVSWFSCFQVETENSACFISCHFPLRGFLKDFQNFGSHSLIKVLEDYGVDSEEQTRDPELSPVLWKELGFGSKGTGLRLCLVLALFHQASQHTDYISDSSRTDICLCFFFDGIEVWTRDLVLVSQVVYHLSHSTCPFCFSCFWDFYAQTDLDCNFFFFPCSTGD